MEINDFTSASSYGILTKFVGTHLGVKASASIFLPHIDYTDRPAFVAQQLEVTRAEVVKILAPELYEAKQEELRIARFEAARKKNERAMVLAGEGA